MVKNQYNSSIRALNIDKGDKFILAKIKKFCNKKDIMIKYTAPYLYKKIILLGKNRKLQLP